MSNKDTLTYDLVKRNKTDIAHDVVQFPIKCTKQCSPLYMLKHQHIRITSQIQDQLHTRAKLAALQEVNDCASLLYKRRRGVTEHKGAN